MYTLLQKNFFAFILIAYALLVGCDDTTKNRITSSIDPEYEVDGPDYDIREFKFKKNPYHAKQLEVGISASKKDYDIITAHRKPECRQLVDIKQISEPKDKLNGPDEHMHAASMSFCQKNISEGVKLLKTAGLLGHPNSWTKLAWHYDESSKSKPDIPTAYLYYTLKANWLVRFEQTHTAHYQDAVGSLKRLHPQLSEKDLSWVQMEVNRHNKVSEEWLAQQIKITKKTKP